MRHRRSAALTLIALSTAASGCSWFGSDDEVAKTQEEEIRDRLAEYRKDPSPGIWTLADRPSDISNNIAVGFDENYRMILGDIIRNMYLDRPSRLSPTPKPR